MFDIKLNTHIFQCWLLSYWCWPVIIQLSSLLRNRCEKEITTSSVHFISFFMLMPKTRHLGLFMQYLHFIPFLKKKKKKPR